MVSNFVDKSEVAEREATVFTGDLAMMMSVWIGCRECDVYFLDSHLLKVDSKRDGKFRDLKLILMRGASSAVTDL